MQSQLGHWRFTGYVSDDSSELAYHGTLTANKEIQHVAIFRVLYYQIDKLAGGVEGTETIRYHIEMLGRKCGSCELWCKEQNFGIKVQHPTSFITKFNRKIYFFET